MPSVFWGSSMRVAVVWHKATRMQRSGTGNPLSKDLLMRSGTLGFNFIRAAGSRRAMRRRHSGTERQLTKVL